MKTIKLFESYGQNKFVEKLALFLIKKEIETKSSFWTKLSRSWLLYPFDIYLKLPSKIFSMKYKLVINGINRN